ncbi:hypothetical protein J3A84_13390 [Proteiniclasticum sp. SCR006]|uniref:Type IV pilus assembly protein PilM n=1 Tax=Proteiniclasticum aestuarii TaxID=2817862 RepID=A0A939KKE8_9CLOT|nr:hypothetical protein [Proteiniclasticum aestuarii]MBO1266026.1 hypothetical protein [Proteiniclasticum aestuarii]
MKELIVYFSQNRIDAYYLEKTGKTLTVLDYHRYKDDESFTQFLNKRKIRQGKAVIEDRETVVKSVTAPLLFSEDVENFVTNNINEYFVLDPNDYEVDYRITSIDRKLKELHLMLTASKKETLDEVRTLFSRNRIRLTALSAMPGLLMNIVQKENKNSTAIIRVVANSAWIHIERQNNVFLHTAINYEDAEGKPTEDTLENIGYYLNFYSRQYFGETIDQVIIQAEKRFEEGLKISLESIYDGDIGTLKLPLFSAKESGLSGTVEPEEAWLQGFYPESKLTYNKEINYATKRDQYIKSNRRNSAIRLTAALLLVTLLIQGGFIVLENYMKSFYNTELVQVPEDRISEVNEILKEATANEKELRKKAEILRGISSENIDYTGYLSAFRDRLPREASIDSISIHKTGIDVSFYFAKEDSRTMDAARTVLAINSTGLFEPVRMSGLSMDNSQEYLQVSLLYKQEESISTQEADGGSEGGTDGL